MKREGLYFAALLLAACDATPTDPGASLRSFECPPGCECICDPGTSSSGSSSSSSSSSPSSSSSSSSSSTGGQVYDWPMTDGTHEVMFEGQLRRYRIRHAQNWDGVTPMPLAFAYHQCTSNPDPVANNGLFALYRNTTWDFQGVPGGRMVLSFNPLTSPCLDADPSGPDVAFATALVQTAEAWEFSDASQRIFTGMSGGAYMAHTMACLMGADAIYAGAGGISDPGAGLGTAFIGSGDCVGPVSVFQSHGANDGTVPVAFAHEARDMWASVNGCGVPAPTPGPQDFCTGNGYNNDPTQPCSCVEYTCTDGGLIYCEDAGGHDWFGEQRTSSREHFNTVAGW